MKQKSKGDIIRETVEYYKTHKRATPKGGGVCYYFMPGEPDCMCAVGRCLTKRNPEILKLVHEAKRAIDFTSKVWVGSVQGLVEKVGDIENALKPVYRGHGKAFWQSLQILHDDNEFWQENDLTKEGKKFVSQLFEEYDSGTSTK